MLHNKICEFVSRGEEYDITIITTDQGRAPCFFDFPKSVKIIDIGINYSAVNTRNPIRRAVVTYRKKRLHFIRLSELLCTIKPDVTITIYPSMAIPLSKIKDGSKKIVEFHANRFFRFHQGYRRSHRIVVKYRTWQDYRFIKKFDELVVLTKEGAEQWRQISNIRVIPNAAISRQSVLSISPVTKEKRVIAVGRLVYEKGYDRLIHAWSILPKEILEEWRLVIIGDGEQKNNLQEIIKTLNVCSSVCIKAPTKQIFDEYAKSAFFVMTSRTEGMPMTLIESMSCGLPAVCFDFACGPKEIIEDGVNGFLVENGNIREFSEKMEDLILNEDIRLVFSEKAKLVKDKFSEEKVTEMWMEFFSELAKKSRNKIRI